MTTKLPNISIVIIGRNEGDRLLRCIESVSASDYDRDRLDIIYVDTNSTDDSCASALKLGARVVEIQPKRPSAAAGRNAGWKVATYDLVQFLDGDTILNPGWLRKAVDTIHDPTVACVFGRREEMAPQATIYNFWAHHDWFNAPGDVTSCGGDTMFRKEVLQRAGGYDEGLIAGEECDLCFRIRSQQSLRIVCLDEPMTLHDMNMTRFSEYWRRCTRTGHAYAEVGGRYPSLESWRKACWRNVIHSAAPLIAIAVSLTLWRTWPMAIWLALLATAMIRNAVRLKPRVGTWNGALAYSAHHYLAKLPIAVGQIGYWIRSAIGKSPQPLIEYRR